MILTLAVAAMLNIDPSKGEIREDEAIAAAYLYREGLHKRRSNDQTMVPIVRDSEKTYQVDLRCLEHYTHEILDCEEQYIVRKSDGKVLDFKRW